MNGREKMNQMLKKLMLMFLLFFIFTMLPVKAQAAPKINKKSITLLKGSSYTLKISGTKNKVTWKTNKKAVAKLVDKKKTSVNVKAVKVGKATVTAKLKGKAYKCNVKVVNPELSNSKLTMTAGSNVTLKVKGGSGNIKWESSDKTVAMVNGGRVTAKKQGTAKITAVQNKKKMVCIVTVSKQAGTDSTENDKKLVEKKIWVVTKMATNVITPIYKNERTLYICLNCGFLDKETGLPVENASLTYLNSYIPIAGFDTAEGLDEHYDESESFFGTGQAECGYYRYVQSNHPIYQRHIECSCGARFRINDTSKGETGYNGEEEFKEHLANNSISFSEVINKSCNNYTVHTYKDFSHYEYENYPEEGYWMEVAEYPIGGYWRKPDERSKDYYYVIEKLS